MDGKNLIELTDRELLVGLKELEEWKDSVKDVYALNPEERFHYHAEGNKIMKYFDEVNKRGLHDDYANFTKGLIKEEDIQNEISAYVNGESTEAE